MSEWCVCPLFLLLHKVFFLFSAENLSQSPGNTVLALSFWNLSVVEVSAAFRCSAILSLLCLYIFKIFPRDYPYQNELGQYKHAWFSSFFLARRLMCLLIPNSTAFLKFPHRGIWVLLRIQSLENGAPILDRADQVL